MTAKSLESGHTGEPCLMADIPPPKRQRGIARIPLDKVPTILHGVPGLIIGPAFSHYPGVIRECADAIASKFGVATSGNLFATVELVRYWSERQRHQVGNQRTYYEGATVAAAQPARQNALEGGTVFHAG